MYTIPCRATAGVASSWLNRGRKYSSPPFPPPAAPEGRGEEGGFKKTYLGHREIERESARRKTYESFSRSEASLAFLFS